MKNIAIFGSGGLGREVTMLVEQLNQQTPSWLLIGFFDDGLAIGTEVYGYKVLGGLKELNDYKEELFIVVAIGNPLIKQRVIEGLNNLNIQFPVLIHPNVLIGRNTIVGEGSIITAGNIITVDVKIGKHVMVNLACTIGHDVSIGDYTSIMPSVNISGKVEIGGSVFIGTGAKTIQQIKIGDNVIIGAGAVVIDSLPKNCTAVGVPARIIKCETT